MTDASPMPVPQALIAHHERSFEQNRFVYPVISRRSGGVSLGINLNPDKVCNFDCIYCQVNRVEPSESSFVETQRLIDELDTMLTLVTSGQLFAHPKFAATPPEWRRLNDLALSGDGEPTTYRNFDEIVAACAEIKRRHHLDGVKLVLITNASMLHRPVVERGLQILDENQGEIWAKLDAGSDEYFQLVERTVIPFRQVLANIERAACQRPIVIQSLFMQIHGVAPSDAEIVAYCERLNEIVAAGGGIKAVQVYTVARQPAESFVTSLTHAQVDAIVRQVEIRTGLVTQAYYGSTPD